MKRNSIDEVYLQYMDDVYRYLLWLCSNHHLAEELLQETYYRAYLFLEHYQGESVKPWLFRVAKNSYIDLMRKMSKQEVREDTYFDQLRSAESVEEELIAKEEWSEIRRNMMQLPTKEKEALILYEFHGFSYQEAAEVMEISLSHYKILLYRARQKLRLKRREREQRDE